MSHAIVTGGAGFIGLALTTRLIEDGWNVTVIDDFSTHDDMWAQVQKIPAEAELKNGRVQDIAPRWGKVDAIFHLAGKVGPVGVLRYKGQIAPDTITGNARVAEWAGLYDCPLIDISTSEIYGSPERTNAEEDPKVFPYPASARMEYAVAKLAAETMLLNSDCDARIIRPFNIAGPGQRKDGGFIIPRFVRQALDDADMTVYYPGTQRRAFTHIDDFIDGLMLVLHKGQEKSVYNLGNPDTETSIIEVAMAVRNAVQKGHITMVDPQSLWGTDFKEAADKVPNAEKAMRELGWKPWRTLDTIIKDVVEYEVQQR